MYLTFEIFTLLKDGIYSEIVYLQISIEFAVNMEYSITFGRYGNDIHLYSVVNVMYADDSFNVRYGEIVQLYSTIQWVSAKKT